MGSDCVGLAELPCGAGTACCEACTLAVAHQWDPPTCPLTQRHTTSLTCITCAPPLWPLHRHCPLLLPQELLVRLGEFPSPHHTLAAGGHAGEGVDFAIDRITGAWWIAVAGLRMWDALGVRRMIQMCARCACWVGVCLAHWGSSRCLSRSSYPSLTTLLAIPHPPAHPPACRQSEAGLLRIHPAY